MPRAVAVVTGASSGIGLETSRRLVRNGMHVVLACRSRARGEQAMKLILGGFDPEQHHGTAEVSLVDFSELSSTATFLKRVKAEHGKSLTTVVLNAGLNTFGEDIRTKDEFEVTWQVNFLAQWMAALYLLPILESAAAERNGQSRLVFLSSLMHWWGNPGDFEGAKDTLRHSSYASSKLACTVAAMELHRRLERKPSRIRNGLVPIACTAVNPGGVSTEIYRDLSVCTRCIMRPLQASLFLSSAQAADVVTHAATEKNVTGGSYWAPLAPPDGLVWADGSPPMNSRGSQSTADGRSDVSGKAGTYGSRNRSASHDVAESNHRLDDSFRALMHPRSWWQWAAGPYAHETLGLFVGPQRHLPSPDAMSASVGELLYDVACKQLRGASAEAKQICEEAEEWFSREQVGVSTKIGSISGGKSSASGSTNVG